MTTPQTSSQAAAVSAPAVRASPRAFQLTLLLLGAVHLTFVAFTGLRPEHVIADGLIMGLPWLGPKALAAARAGLPVWITGVVVDNQRYLPMLGKIHTGDMRALALSLFPAPGHVTWPEYLNAHPHAVLDFLCGFSYATFLFEIAAVAVFLYVVQREKFAPIAWAFFWANLFGAVIYMFCPVAPPWYVIQHGLGPAVATAAPGLGGCARFDKLIGFPYFAHFYARNPDVFGAMPSLHVAYPLLCVLYTWDRGWKWRVPTIAFDALVAFSAVYLAHHWILDVLAGFAVAVVSYYLGNRVAKGVRLRAPSFRSSGPTGFQTIK